MQCPCSSGQTFDQCCEPYLTGASRPPTASALMRSRYTAFVKGEFGYIRRTLAPESREDFDLDSVKESARQVKWKGLEIHATERGGENDDIGTVEFTARYQHGDQPIEHRELSHFRKDDDGQWLFVDGEVQAQRAGQGTAPVQRQQPKVGRNDPCTCGSGKKYKKCCGLAA